MMEKSTKFNLILLLSCIAFVAIAVSVFFGIGFSSSFAYAADTTTVSGRWYWNDELSSSSDFNESVQFVSGAVTYVAFSIDHHDNLYYFTGVSSDPYVIAYDGDSGLWGADYYRLIDFGSSEVTVSSTFYSFLKKYAVQVDTVDYVVSGQWKWNDTLSSPSRYLEARFSSDPFTSDSTSYYAIGITTDDVLSYFAPATWTVVYDAGDWVSEDWRIVDFGTSPISVPSSFAEYLWANATLITSGYSISAYIDNGTYVGSTSIPAGVSFTARISPDDGYVLPGLLTVVSGAEVSYNNSTGALTIYDVTDNVIIRASCVSLAATDNIIAGKYLMDWSITLSDSTELFNQAVNFSVKLSSGETQSFTRMAIEDVSSKRVLVYYNDMSDIALKAYTKGVGWVVPDYQTVDFGGSAQSVSTVFKSWISANGTLSNQSYLDGYSAGLIAANSIISKSSASYVAGYASAVDELGEDTMYSYLSGIGEIPFKIVKSMLNFEILGVNVVGLVTGILTSVLVIWLIRRFI